MSNSKSTTRVRWQAFSYAYHRPNCRKAYAHALYDGAVPGLPADKQGVKAAEAFCKREGIKASTFATWAATWRREAAEANAKAERAAKRQAAKARREQASQAAE